MPPLQTASKEKSANAFSCWVESLDLLTLVVYSDGSLSSERAASYGFTIYQSNIPIFNGSGRLGPAESYPSSLGARALQYRRQRTGRQAGKGSIIAPRARRRSTDAGLPTKNRKTEAERSVPGVVAACRSSRSRAQPCTICWQRDPSMGTSLRITRDLTITTHAWSAHVADAKHRITSSTAERYRHVIG
ncbi:Uncharacterized protein HZ326_27297 [Fusarium oxysporum f. sp. albedinis]|nr:Uncharacterized protein HZ326_27297 [Fusarium oxysporum f. sp. albedinis]